MHGPGHCHAQVAALAGAVLAAAALATGCGVSQTGSAGASPAPRTVTAARAPAEATQPSTTSIAGPPRTGRVKRSPHSVAKPRILWDPIPFGSVRRAEMAAYARRHYGLRTYKLIDPHVIVIHYTDTSDFQSTFNTFAPDTPDSELHELPNTCAHFVIDRAGVIRQLVSVNIMCRHTVGLNWTSIGIEHVGFSDAQVLGDGRQMSSSLRLVRWLRCRFHVSVGNVIGHNESLSSRYHHENVASLRMQTHGDWVRADMRVYRGRLARMGACPRT